MGQITEAYVQNQIPAWIDDEVLEGLQKTWNESIEDGDDPEAAGIDFPKYIRKGTNWALIHSDTSDATEHIHVFGLTPAHVFEGVFFIEVITDAKDEELRSFYIATQ